MNNDLKNDDADDEEVVASVRATLDAVGDSATPASSFESIVARTQAPAVGEPQRRPAILALCGVAIVALVAGLVVVAGVRNEAERSSDESIAQDDDSAPVSAVVEPIPATTATTSVSTADADANEATEEVPGVHTGIPLEEIEQQRVDALRALTGFSAIVTTSGTTTTAQFPVARTVDLTVLADGSFFGQSITTGEWESYDTSTQIARRSQLAGETLTYQEANGETFDNLRYRFAGRSPTDPIGVALRPEVGIDIVESTWEGRPSWTITFDQPEFELPEDCGALCDFAVDLTEQQIVDQETGLIVVDVQALIESPNDTFRSEYTDLTIVDELPAAFPGEFPLDAAVERTPNDFGGTPIAFDDIPGYFGIPTPLPGDPDEFVATISFIGNDEPTGDLVADRVVDFVRKDGFLRTTVTLYAELVAPENPSEKDANNFLCAFGIGDDGECEQRYPFGSVPRDENRRVGTFESGVFAGADFVAGGGSITTGIGPISVDVSSVDDESALAVIESFVLAEP